MNEPTERATSSEESREQAHLADLGELAGPLAHEFNNFLNNLLLQVAVLELSAKPGVADLGELKKKGKAMAALVKQWQLTRRTTQSKPRLLDLNAEVQAVVAEQGSGIETFLAPERPTVFGSGVDLRRLCTFLLAQARSAARGNGTIKIETEAGPESALLRVEDAGPPLAQEELMRVFDPSLGRAGIAGLELAACQSLTRRLGGQISISQTPGGTALVVELPVSGEKAAEAKTPYANRARGPAWKS